MQTKVQNFIGIDISKETFDLALIKNCNKNNITSVDFDNTITGFKKMKKLLVKKFNIDLQKTVFCIEHTGIYSRAIAKFLLMEGSSVWMENPSEIKHSLGLQRGKNDKIDAKRIATYAYKNREDVKLWQPPKDVLYQIKGMLALRERLMDSKNAILHPIKELMSIGEKQEAENLKKVCKKSVASMEKDIEQIERKLDGLIKIDEEITQLYNLALSVPGIGKFTTLYLLYHTNGFKMYKNAKQLATYSGIAPFEHTSGTSVRGKTRVSHMANKTLKRLLTMGAISTIAHNSEMKKYFDRKVKEGKNKMLVINAVRNKIIHRLAAVIKRRTPYEEWDAPVVFTVS